MDLGFFAADTLGVTLYQLRGNLTAHETQQIRLGPWDINVSIHVDSDILSGVELGFWLTIAKTLRCYVVIREKENWLFVLDATAVQPPEKYVGEGLKERILEIRPAIKGVFRWTPNEWVQMKLGTNGV